MVKYRYGLASDGTVIDAVSLRGTETKSIRFTCLGCAQPLIAKANGTQMRPHFAHAVETKCDGESYLHRLGKQIFVETFRECQKNGLPFEFEVEHATVCRRFASIFEGDCTRSEPRRRIYDLTKIYGSIEVETRDGQFIPDVRLTRPGSSDDSLYIEIAHTSFLSVAKAESKQRIIEIPIQDESDLDIIRGRRLDATNCRLVNLAPQIGISTDEDCVCHAQASTAVYVALFNSGACRAFDGTLIQLDAMTRKVRHAIVSGRLYWSNDWTHWRRQKQDAYRDAVTSFAEDGEFVRDCSLCVHFIPSNRRTNAPRQCRLKKERIRNQTIAKDCEEFAMGDTLM